MRQVATLVELRHFQVLAGCFTCNWETIKTQLLKSEIKPRKSFLKLIYLLPYFGYLPVGLESLKLHRAIQELTEVNVHQLTSGPHNSRFEKMV